MRAMVLESPGGRFELRDVPVPQPGAGQVLIEVAACGVCRTDLHVVDGEIRDGRYPLIPGHQIVGRVVQAPPDSGLALGMRVGVPWLGYTCGECAYCRSDRENLCDRAEFTGYQRPGGYAEYVVADQRFCFPLPETYPDLQAAPLLCAGLIGYRALRMAGAGREIGFYGFGNAAHILTQIAAWQGRSVYAFTRAGDAASQAFARSLGAVWAGGTDETPPVLLEAAIIFAPAGELVPQALERVAKGGRVVCAGIHMSDIPSFAYHSLWGERCICSVANLTRADGRELLDLAPRAGVRTEVARYPLERTVEALADLRDGRIQGAAVVTLQ
jgi:alcohol dehydrogenase, propanol-preferring